MQIGNIRLTISCENLGVDLVFVGNDAISRLERANAGKTGDDLAWDEMWARKCEGREMFAQAELVEEATFSVWHGHDTSPEFTYYNRPAGTKVLITVASRFGDVGIRDTHIDEEIHGYSARVMPERLKNLKFLSDGGVSWRSWEPKKSG